MMSAYFDFQKEARNILLWSEVNSRRYSTSFGTWGLFTSKTLSLHLWSAIDIVANNTLWKAKAALSNTLTTAVLFLMVSTSVVQSNTEWIAILFADYPVVRDYKEMLDIETELFNVAYFRSKQINLTRPFESDLLWNLSELIAEYQQRWLFETWNSVGNDVSMADIIMDLNAMNAVMKQFIMVGWSIWMNGLLNYNGCLWSVSSENCNRNVSVLKFSSDAINKLYSDYKDVRGFGKCNAYWQAAKSQINGLWGDTKTSLKSSVKDMKDAADRLLSAMLWKNNWKKKENRCDLSDYEMAQLQAYRWWDWTCNTSLVDAQTSVLPDTSDSSKRAQRSQKQKTESWLKKAAKQNNSWVLNVQDWLKWVNGTSQREQTYRSMIWSWVFNPEFSFDMNDRFVEVYDEIKLEIRQAQENAISADVGDLLPKGKWILDQLDTAIKRIGKEDNKQWLETQLQKIEDKQCTG